MKKILNDPVISNMIKAVSVLVMLAAAGIAFIYFGTDGRTLLLTAVYMLFYVFFPGLYLINALDIRGEHTSTYAVRGFFTGFAAQIMVYFLSDLIGTDILLWSAGPIMSIGFFINAYRNSDGEILRKPASTILKAPVSFYCFVMLVFMYSMLNTQYTYISPQVADYSFLKIDFAFHAGIVNALSLGFPPLDPWIDGRTIEYHMFTEMLYSVPVRLFGLHSEEILMSCTPYIITPVFSISLYSFYKEFSGRKDRAGLYCLATHLANMFMVKGFASSWFLFHIYSNINNAGMGLSCLIVILPLIKLWDKEVIASDSRTNTKEMLFLGVMVMLLTGIKGPFSIVLVAALVGTVIMGAMLKSVNRGELAATGISAIGFILVYIYILGAQHSNETGGRLFNLWEVTDIFFIKEETLETVPGPKLAGYAVLLMVFMLCYLTAFFLPFIIGYIREFVLIVSKKKEFVFSRVLIYAAALVGFGAMMVLDFAGHSQVYFGFVTSLLVPMISFWFFEDISSDKGAFAKAIRWVFCAGMVAMTLTSMLYIYDRVLAARDTYMLRNENSNTYRNVSTKEYEGLEWLRNNTARDSLVASDRYSSAPPGEYDVTQRGDNTHFAYAVYSNRRQYIEGSGFSLDDKDYLIRKEKVDNNIKLYDPESKERGELAKELGIDYMVVSKRFSEAADYSSEDFERCFSNEEMDIYRVVK